MFKAEFQCLPDSHHYGRSAVPTAQCPAIQPEKKFMMYMETVIYNFTESGTQMHVCTKLGLLKVFE